MLLQPQPPPDFFTLVFVLVKVMSSSGVAVGAEARAEGGGGVMSLQRCERDLGERVKRRRNRRGRKKAFDAGMNSAEKPKKERRCIVALEKPVSTGELFPWLGGQRNSSSHAEQCNVVGSIESVLKHPRRSVFGKRPAISTVYGWERRSDSKSRIGRALKSGWIRLKLH